MKNTEFIRNNLEQRRKQILQTKYFRGYVHADACHIINIFTVFVNCAIIHFI